MDDALVVAPLLALDHHPGQVQFVLHHPVCYAEDDHEQEPEQAVGRMRVIDVVENVAPGDGGVVVLGAV